MRRFLTLAGMIVLGCIGRMNGEDVIPKTDARAIARLIEELRSADPAAAGKAAFDLGRLKEKAAAAVPDLVAALSDRRPLEDQKQLIPVGPQRVASLAAEALVAIGPAAVPSLIGELKQGDEARQLVAIRLLGRIGSPAAAAWPLLRTIAMESGDGTRRQTALFACDQVAPNDESRVQLFRSQLADSDADICSLAVQLLGKLGTKSRSALPDLLPLLADQRSRVEQLSYDFFGERALREDVIEAIGLIGAPEATASLEKSMKTETANEVVFAAAVALVRIKPNHDAARQTLLAPLSRDADDLNSRHAAIDALSTLGPAARWAQATVNVHADDKSEEIRRAVMKANGAIRSPESAAILIRGLSDQVESVQSSAIFGLGELGNNARPGVPKLVEILHKGGGFLDGDIVWTLGVIGPAAEEAIPAIEDWAKRSNNDNDRAMALDAISRIRSAERSR